MSTFSLTVLPPEQLRALAAQRQSPVGGGNAIERGLGLAVALVAIAAGAVLACLT